MPSIAPPYPSSRLLQALARAGLERPQHLVDLHRRRGLRRRDRVAVLQHGAAGRPGLDIEEEVALEEDARADLHARVSWIGSASLVSFIVTVIAGESPPTDLTPATLPTSTPAIRTACPFWIGGAFVKVAFSSYGRVNGMSFVNAR